jgi:tRNA(Met) cytidine acetyltransferase
MTVSDKNLTKLIEHVLAQAASARHRGMLIVAGDVVYCRNMATQVVRVANLSRVTWVSNCEQADAQVLSASETKQLLGQERDMIVFDAHAGFDADAFGAVSGVIPGGGLLLLLCPPLTQWAQLPDPAAERIAVWPYEIADISGRFIRRLISVLQQAHGVMLVEQGSPLPAFSSSTKTSVVQNNVSEERDAIFRTEDQRAAVDAIEQLALGQHSQVAVLVADRGRGKTTALGIAAARLLQAQARRIVVTAPRPAAVQPLFQQAQKMLPQVDVGHNVLQYNGGSIQFIAPDALCLSEMSADLLLVDEAAAIPASLLQQFLPRFPRIIFSTTTHGYEGTGRGFAVRFRQTLDEQSPGWLELDLQTPVRWAKDDPVEALVFDALLLAAESAEDEAIVAATVDNVVVEQIDRDSLLSDEQLLSQLFGLLVVAHYRTRPTDLRNLLDGPGLSVYVTRYQGQVVATALVSNEGGFDAEMSEAIYAGRRRPRGHLIPQSLTTHCGIKAAAGLRCARVMRIAVHPALQRQGLGSQLLQFIRHDAQQQGADLFGASFGATPSLLHFWAQEKLLPVRMGFRRGHASGEYSVMVLAALSAAGEAVYTAARARFVRDLPLWLADPLRQLDAGLAAVLQQHGEASEDALPPEHERQMLHSFARGARTYEDALGPIWRLLASQDLQAIDSLAGAEQKLLLAKVIEKQTWAEVAARFALAGKAEVLAGLRSGVLQLLATQEDKA